MKQFSNLQGKRQKIQMLGVVMVIFFSVILCGCVTTKSSAIITGTVRPAISPGEVKIYIDPPAKFETIGVVEATRAVSGLGSSRQETQDKVLNELKFQAAKIGANGILLLGTGTKLGETVSGYTSDGAFYSASTSDKVATQVRAIYVIQE